MDGSGNLFIADTYNSRIRKVNVRTHEITTVAGNGEYAGYGGDGGPATDAELFGPGGVTVDASGDLFIADSYNSRIREVNASSHASPPSRAAVLLQRDGCPATAVESCPL